jgi:hypothetical protein
MLDCCCVCELRCGCLAKSLENVNPEIDRNGYHRYDNYQDDKEWRYLCFSMPDNIKNNSICDSMMMVPVISALTKVGHGLLRTLQCRYLIQKPLTTV